MRAVACWLAVGFLVCVAPPAQAAAMRATAAVSVTIPPLTGVRLQAGGAASSVSLSLFRTTGIVVLRSGADTRSPFVQVGFPHSGEAAMGLESGGWRTIHDEVRPRLQPVSTRREAEGAADATYEIWAF